MSQRAIALLGASAEGRPLAQSQPDLTPGRSLAPESGLPLAQTSAGLADLNQELCFQEGES